MEKRSKIKSAQIYQLIDNSNGFYLSPVAAANRSRVNIPFRICEQVGLEEKFLKQASDKNMVQLKGHRSVGGIRASLFNAMSLDETKYLAKFMNDFEKSNQLKK